MNLEVTNPKAEIFTDQLGIPPDRIDELAKLMNEAVEKRKTGKLESISLLFLEIAGFCNNLQEYTFCVISHTCFMGVVHGHTYCPPKDKSHA